MKGTYVLSVKLAPPKFYKIKQVSSRLYEATHHIRVILQFESFLKAQFSEVNDSNKLSLTHDDSIISPLLHASSK